MGILSRKEHPPMRSNNRELAATALMAAVTAALAWVVIPLPFTPVPVSGQTVGVMLAGLFLPPQLAALSQVIYIALGVLGLPVFAGGSAGLGTIFGPTGGYIWAFVLAALCISWAVRKVPSSTRIGYFAILALGGIGLIYVFGIIQLMAVTGIGLAQAVTAGALPFLPGDLAKVLLVTEVARRRPAFSSSAGL
jgi:biotin transport system substrate-specific component